MSRDLCVGANFPTFEIPDPDLPIHYITFWYYDKDKWSYLPKTVLKTTQLSAHAQNQANPECCRKSFTTIVLGDHDFPLTTSHFCNLTAFMAIFSHIFTVHVQKLVFMNFRINF